MSGRTAINFPLIFYYLHSNSQDVFFFAFLLPSDITISHKYDCISRDALHSMQHELITRNFS